jgi:hypothetical protein
MTMYDDGDTHGAARNTDPETSREAADSLKTSHLQEIILTVLGRARAGLTTHEIAAACGIGYQTITPRMKALCSKALVYDTGLRRTWEGGPGSPATTRKSIVWQLTALRDESPVTAETQSLQWRAGE